MSQDPFVIVYDVVGKPECWCEYVDIGVGHQKVAENPDCPQCTPEGLTGAVLTALAKAGLLRGTSGPQSDEPTAPRVWAMPSEPGPDVVRVRDVYGQCFERADAVDEHGSVPVWTGDTFADEDDIPDLTLSWKHLMAGHAPLTEVVDGSGT